MIVFILFIVAAVVAYFFFTQNKKIKIEHENLENQYKDLNHTKKSQSVIYGKSIEQFSPFMHYYPYNRKDARFLGTPIDYIQFNFMPNERDDEIVLIEVKGCSSQLTERERRIKSIVERGRIRYEEFRVR